MRFFKVRSQTAKRRHTYRQCKSDHHDEWGAGFGLIFALDERLVSSNPHCDTDEVRVAE